MSFENSTAKEMSSKEIIERLEYIYKLSEKYKPNSKTLKPWKQKKEQLTIPAVVKSSYCECDAPIIRTSVNMEEYCGNCGEDIKK